MPGFGDIRERWSRLPFGSQGFRIYSLSRWLAESLPDTAGL